MLINKKSTKHLLNDIRGTIIGFLVPTIIYKFISLVKAAIEDMSTEDMLYTMDIYFHE